MLRPRGCWTCRLRHKKCDEARPFCHACTSRNVKCYGYGEKPAWLDGGSRELEQLQQIKWEVKANFRLQRRRRANSTDESRRSSSIEQRLKSPGRPDSADSKGDNAIRLSLTPSKPENSTSEIQTCNDGTYHRMPNPPANATTASQVGNEGDREQHDFKPKVLSYRDAELLMHYFDQVFPLQFRFHTQDLERGGRGWLLWLLVKTGPLYHAALSLSALHQYTLYQPRDVQKLTELNDYHCKALQDLQSFIQQSFADSSLDNRSRQIEVLACGVSLISFQLFQGGLCDWQLHLNALATIIQDQETVSKTDDTAKPCSNVSNSNETLRLEQTALPFLVTIVLWFDLVSCTSTGGSPRLPYKDFLSKQGISLADVMGCQNWAMLAIGDLANLNEWKMRARQAGSLNVRELVARSQEIEDRLEQGLATLESTRHYEIAEQRRQTRPHFGSAIATASHAVTRVFASAALVQLHVIVSGSDPMLPEIAGAVEKTIAALNQVSKVQDMRGLIWPICISGCMAKLHCQPFFQDLIVNVLRNSEQDFGNSSTLLRIMKKCWDERVLSPNSEWNWERAMADMGICALLV